MSIGDFYVCPNCGGKQGFHNLPCSGATSWHVFRPGPTGIPDPALQPAPLTESDVRRIVLDVLERVSESGSRFGFLQHRSLRTAIAAVRKELNL